MYKIRLFFYKVSIPLFIIIVYSVQFENHKLIQIGVTFFMLSTFYTSKINRERFYFAYSLILFLMLYISLGLFFILFFLINDMLIYVNLNITSEIHIYFLSMVILWIYVYISVYFTKVFTKV